MSLDRLTALDRLMLGASRRWPQDIGALAILDGGPLLDEDGRFRIETVRDAVHRRLHLVPRFRQLIDAPRRGLGGPLWVDAPTFDLSRHVRELPLEPPVGEAEMLAAVEQLLRQRMDPSRPLWEMWFLTGTSRSTGRPIREDPPHDRRRDGGDGDDRHVAGPSPGHAAGGGTPVATDALAVGACAPRRQPCAPSAHRGRLAIGAVPASNGAAPAARGVAGHSRASCRRAGDRNQPRSDGRA